MVQAFVFVDAAPGTAEGLPSVLDGVEPVQRAHVVAGDHDVVIEVEADAVYEVLSTVTDEVRPLDGVEGTRTYVALE